MIFKRFQFEILGLLFLAFSLILFILLNNEVYVFVCKILNKTQNLTNLSRYYSVKILVIICIFHLGISFLLKNSLGFAFGLCSLCLFCLGIYFLPVFEYDKMMGFFGPLIERYKNPSFLKNDWWLNISENVNAYYFFTKFLSFFQSQSLPQVVFAIWCLIISSYSFIVLYISKLLVGTPHYFFVGLMCFLIGVNTTIAPTGHYGMFALGDNDFLYYWLNPQSTALCFAFFSLFTYWKKNWFYSSLLMGIAMLFHINTGQHFIFIIFVCFLYDLKNKKSISFILNFITWFVVALIISSPNLLPVLTDFINKKISNYEPTYTLVMVLGGFRQPHHLIPSTWPVSLFIYFFLLFWIAICGYYMKTNRNIFDKYFSIIILAISCLCLLGYLFVEIFPLDFFALLQVFRLTLVAKIIFIQYASITIFLVLSSITSLYKFSLPRYFNKISIFIVLSFSIYFLVHGSYKQISITPTDPMPVEKWISEFTDENSIFVMAPDNNLREFPVKAQRALFADHNRVPYQGYRYEEWFLRMCEAFNLEYEPNLQEILQNRWNSWVWNFKNKDYNSFKILTKKYGVTHVLTWNHHYIPGATLVYTDDDYNVYQL